MFLISWSYDLLSNECWTSSVGDGGRKTAPGISLSSFSCVNACWKQPSLLLVSEFLFSPSSWPATTVEGHQRLSSSSSSSIGPSECVRTTLDEMASLSVFTAPTGIYFHCSVLTRSIGFYPPLHPPLHPSQPPPQPLKRAAIAAEAARQGKREREEVQRVKKAT